MTLDELMCKQFHAREYHCWHFVCDVWRHMTGDELTAANLQGSGTKESQALVDSWAGTKYSEFALPESPCIVLFERTGFRPHVGVFRDGRVLHLSPRGVKRQPLAVARMGFQTVRYFRPCTQF